MSMSVKQVDKETPIIWDEDYNDPGAEIVLVSNDNVGFRAPLWKLRKKAISKFIADLVEVAGSDNNDTEQNPILLDYSALVVRTFLTLVYTPSTQRLNFESILSWDICVRIITLCDQFQSPQVDKRFLQDLSISTIASSSSWEIFRLANIREDVQLAKAILPKFDLVDTISSAMMYDQMKTRGLEGITGKWMIELLRLRTSYWGSDDTEPQIHRNPWEYVANHFDP